MTKLKSLLISVLMGIVSIVSPQIKEFLHSMVKKLYALAKESKTPIDDIFVRLLANLLDVDLPDD